MLKSCFINYKDVYEKQKTEDPKIESTELKRVKGNQEVLINIFKNPSTSSIQRPDISKELRSYLAIDEISILDNPLNGGRKMLLLSRY